MTTTAAADEEGWTVATKGKREKKEKPAETKHSQATRGHASNSRQGRRPPAKSGANGGSRPANGSGKKHTAPIQTPSSPTPPLSVLSTPSAPATTVPSAAAVKPATAAAAVAQVKITPVAAPVKQEAKQEAKEELRQLYPPIQPYNTGFLKVSDVHTLYYEEVGNPEGKPVVFLHGGPGGGLCDYYRQYFNPKLYRVVLFDQRGAGKSTPTASLEDNTTWDLVRDIEKLRTFLKIDKWVVFGGSWGSTLALAYAETHPNRVKALVLRGIFALRLKELLWFYQEGASFIFPDVWEKFLAPIPHSERGNLMFAYYRRLTGSDEKVKLECAKAWSAWEMATSRLYVDAESIKRAEDDAKFSLAFARIEAHYFVNAGFFDVDGQLLENANKIANIPGVIVQGRYDLVCPAYTAWDLHKVWPKGELKWVADAGHSSKEPGIIHELVKACDAFATL